MHKINLPIDYIMGFKIRLIKIKKIQKNRFKKIN